MKMEKTESLETSAYKIQTPGNCPQEFIKRSEHGENFEFKKAGPSPFALFPASEFELSESTRANGLGGPHDRTAPARSSSQQPITSSSASLNLTVKVCKH
jgi:hypothetical protein